MLKVMSPSQGGCMKVKGHRPEKTTSLLSPAQLLAQPGDLSFNPIHSEKGQRGKGRSGQ